MSTLNFVYRGLEKVISGGQIGADQGGLAAAFKAGLLTGGTAPRGYKVSGGTNVLLELFGLQESPSADYPPRTEQNVKDSDGTLIVAADPDSAGEVLTLALLQRYKKPYYVINLVDATADLDRGFDSYLHGSAARAADWVIKNHIRVLNVAGNRDVEGQTAVYEITRLILQEVFYNLDERNLLIRDTDI